MLNMQQVKNSSQFEVIIQDIASLKMRQVEVPRSPFQVPAS